MFSIVPFTARLSTTLPIDGRILPAARVAAFSALCLEPRLWAAIDENGVGVGSAAIQWGSLTRGGYDPSG
ncbi:MAG: hypothetical protein SNJ59_16805 [Aggregatilineales bacterium]